MRLAGAKPSAALGLAEGSRRDIEDVPAQIVRRHGARGAKSQLAGLTDGGMNLLSIGRNSTDQMRRS